VSLEVRDLGFFDRETGQITSAEYPFGAKEPMCPPKRNGSDMLGTGPDSIGGKGGTRILDPGLMRAIEQKLLSISITCQGTSVANWHHEAQLSLTECGKSPAPQSSPITTGSGNTVENWRLRDVGAAGSNPVTPSEENFRDLPRGAIKLWLGV